MTTETPHVEAPAPQGEVPDPGPGIPPTLAKLAVPITGLTHYGRNPRRGDVAMIERSLRMHGQYRPVVVRAGTNEILAGNHTVMAARALGWQEIAATFMDVDDDQAARIVLVDNASADAAGYDTAVLQELLAELALTAHGLEGTGFDADGLAALQAELAGLDSPEDAEAKRAGVGALAERYGMPPFSVLDARAGTWRERKKAWLATGIRSEVGRPKDLVFDSPQSKDPDFYRRKLARERAIGRELTTEEYLTDHYTTEGLVLPSSTSVFDPVLCEQVYRWFCPPTGHVLDPFAGGSVRGIVAAVLGRDYTGVDLSVLQIGENRRQAAELLPGFTRPPGPTGPAVGGHALTPVEEHGGFRVKREDAWAVGQASGAKSRTMWRLLADGQYEGLITAGASSSPQIERAALVAQHLGLPCRVHTGEARPTAEMRTAEAAGAEVLTHRPGRLSVIKARFRTDAEEHPTWLAMPYGMGTADYIEDVAHQVANLPADTGRVVVPVGSGMTLAGILVGLREQGRTVPVLGVRVGGDPTTALDTYAPGWRTEVELVVSPLEYKQHAANRLGDLVLDPVYEAKCVPYLLPGDVLWAVGVRASALGFDAPAALGTPSWIVGDSRQLPELLPRAGAYDLLFSCPPYADLERYSDDPADLSTLGYEEFREAHAAVIGKACERLRPDSFAVWVVGEVRDRKHPSGAYHGFVVDTIDAFRAAGLHFYNEAILLTPVGSTAVTVCRGFEVSRKLGKTHQNVLVFVKGDARVAAGRCGAVDAVEIPDADQDE